MHLSDQEPLDACSSPLACRTAFEHAAQQIAFEELIQAVEQAQARRQRLDEQMVALLPT
jgi:hypothetical protein